MSRRGQILIEAALSLPAALLLSAGTVAVLLALLGKMALGLESYALARAHLYGNAAGICKSSFFGQGHLRVSYECSAPATVRGELRAFGYRICGSDVRLR